MDDNRQREVTLQSIRHHSTYITRVDMGTSDRVTSNKTLPRVIYE